MSESTVKAKGQTTVPADIGQAMGGTSGTRLAWHVLWGSRLVVCVKNKTASDVKGMLKSPKGKRLSIEEMGPLINPLAQQICWRRLNIDQLCRFKIDQGLKLGF